MFASLVAIVAMSYDPSSAPYAIPAKGGQFVVTSLEAFPRMASGRQREELTGQIENATGRQWDNIQILVQISGGGQSKTARIRIPSMPPESSQGFTAEIPSEPFQVDSYSFRLVGGVASDTPEESARKTADARVRAARDREERARYLAQFPMLLPGSEAAFVGADRKCAAQFVEAMQMEGLEKRKRIAELISFRCGFTVKCGTRVQPLNSESGYTQVKVVEGERADQAGWVPAGWIRKPGQ